MTKYVCLPRYFIDPSAWDYRLGLTPYPTTREYYKSMGIKCNAVQHQGLMFEVELPDGWSVNHLGESVWYEVLDDKNRVRFTCSIHLKDYHTAYTVKGRRYNFKRNDEIYRLTNTNLKSIQHQVLDGNKVIYSTDIKTIDWAKPDEAVLQEKITEHEQKAECWRYLKEHFPRWKNPLAYWD